MHTYVAPGGTVFTSNSDLSGEVRIQNQDKLILHVYGPDLLAFVADFVQRARIAALEDAPHHDILGLDAEDMP